MSIIGSMHAKLVFNRRIHVLSQLISEQIPQDQTVLDIGCGDGQLSKLILDHRPDLSISGVEISLRPKTHIPVSQFDGHTLPQASQSVDWAMFVDVLHHTEDPAILLREASRVARRGIIIKDHLKNSALSGTILRVMDWVGNAHHGVVLPYNYWSTRQWHAAFSSLNLSIDSWEESLKLYPVPVDWIFGRGLHFVARLIPR